MFGFDSAARAKCIANYGTPSSEKENYFRIKGRPTVLTDFKTRY
jgi:hypothetical protein